MIEVSKSPMSSCAVCGYSRNSCNKMKKHYRREHADLPELTCAFCNFVTLDDKSMKCHKKYIHPQEKLVCSCCNFATKKWVKWVAHLEQSHKCQQQIDGNIPDHVLKQNHKVLQRDSHIPVYHNDRSPKVQQYNGDIQISNNKHDKEDSICEDPNHLSYADPALPSRNNKNTEGRKTKRINSSQEHIDLFQTFSQCSSPSESVTVHHRKRKSDEARDEKTAGHLDEGLSKYRRSEVKKNISLHLTEANSEILRDKDGGEHATESKHQGSEVKKSLKWMKTKHDVSKVEKTAENVTKSTCRGSKENGVRSSHLSETKKLSQTYVSQDSNTRMQEKSPTDPSTRCTSEKKDTELDQVVTPSSSSEPVKCAFCDVHCTSLKRLKKHYRKRHKQISLLECVLCDYVTDCVGEMKKHKRHVHPSERLICMECQFSTKRWTKWWHHMESVHGTIRTDSNTEIMSKELSAIPDTHQIDQSRSTATVTVPCKNINTPNRQFYADISSSQGEVEANTTLKSKPVVPVISQSVKIKNHNEKHSKSSDKYFKCDECDVSYMSLASLKRHQVRHISKKMFQCSLCRYSSFYKTYLKLHMMRYHGEERKRTRTKNPRICPYCTFTAPSKDKLTRHVNGHLNIKPYKCLFCDFATTYETSLRHHTMRHTGERPHACQLCSKSFKRHDELLYHMNALHPGVK